MRLRFPISFTPDISESLKNIKNFVFILNIKGNNGIPSLGYCIPSLGYSIINILHWKSVYIYKQTFLNQCCLHTNNLRLYIINTYILPHSWSDTTENWNLRCDCSNNPERKVAAFFGWGVHWWKRLNRI